MTPSTEEVQTNTIRNDVTAVGRLEPARPAQGAKQAAATAPSARPLPASPPPEVLEELDQAAGVLAGLDEAGLELRLADGSDGVRVELRERDGGLVRTVPYGQLLDALSGSGRGLLVDEQG